MPTLQDTIEQYLDSQIFLEILAKAITHMMFLIDVIKESELVDKKGGEEIDSMKEKPDNLLITPRITSRANTNWIKIEKGNSRNYLNIILKRDDQNIANMKRIRRLIKFMENNVESTNFFHSEVQRIRRNREVKDEIRKMIHIADTTKNKSYAKAINKCYDLVVDDKEVALYSAKFNNLVIKITD